VRVRTLVRGEPKRYGEGGSLSAELVEGRELQVSRRKRGGCSREKDQ
jgi:hypothetical protein